MPDTPGESEREPKINKYFRAVTKMDASDLHMKAGIQPRVRLGGKLRSLAGKALSSEKIDAMMFEIMSDRLKEDFARNGSVDFAHQLGNSDRFRINMFRQRGQTSVAARRVTAKIADFTSLGLPDTINKITEFHQGLVLLVGVTGSGKSTTIAAALDYINATRACHIVTLEDPIEYLFADKKAIVNQREIGIDVPDFAMGLKYLMREDPDVVLVGEMRDEETFHAALNAAETGHLVFGTLHASGSAQTITRLLDLLPEGSRDLVRQSLVFNLKAVVSQKLLPSIVPGRKRVPAVEIMLTNSTIRKLIDEKREDEIPDVLKMSYEEGMMDFNESIRRLVEEEAIELSVAYSASPNPDELKMRLKGITAGSGGLLG
jgi:twitching motility protein PilT